MFNSLFDAYTVRKVAPRLIVAVIGVNLSIYLCVAAVDITNIIGGGIADLVRQPFKQSGSFDSIGLPANAINEVVGVGGVVGVVGLGLGATVASGGVLGTIASSAFLLAGQAAAAIGLFLLIAMVSVALIVLAIAATIVIRYGAILVLTLFAPIAIALLVLPGTEKYFKAWWDIFMKTLIMYPIIAIIFAISDILAALLLVTLGQQNQGIAFIGIFVVIIALYAPLFMIPFAYKMAGGVVGGVYDFANKNGIARVGERMKKFKEDPHSFYGRARTARKLERERQGLTGKQIGGGIVAGSRSWRRNRREGLRGGALRQRALADFGAENRRIGNVGGLEKAIELEEKDEDLKTVKGNDDYGKAVRALIEHGYSAASAALIASNGEQYDFHATHASDGRVLTDQDRENRRRAHDNMLNLAETSRSRYGDEVALIHGTLQDHASGTGSDAAQMREDVIHIAHGDGTMEAALTNAYRERAKAAKRTEKAGLGFSTDLTIMQALKEGRITREEAQDQITEASLARSSAGEIATQHVRGLRDMRESIIRRVRRFTHDANGQPLNVTQAELDANPEYQRAVAQMANIYDAIQYEAPDQLMELEYEAPDPNNPNAPRARTGFMGRQDASASGESLQMVVERYRGATRDVRLPDGTVSSQPLFPEFANARRDFPVSEAARRAQQNTGQGMPGAGLGG